MRSGDFRQIERGLDGERLGNRRVRIFPVLQRAFGLAGLQLVASGIDQRAGFAVNAGDRVGPERRNRAEAVQQNVVGHRFHDAWHARHVELERADAELLGVAGNFLDLFFREDLRMENRVHIAALIHRLPESGQVIEIGILQTAQENPDTGDAAKDRCAGLRLGFAFVGLLVADMDVRVEDSGEHRAAGGVIGFGAGILRGCRRSRRSCRRRSRRRP